MRPRTRFLSAGLIPRFSSVASAAWSAARVLAVLALFQSVEAIDHRLHREHRAGAHRGGEALEDELVLIGMAALERGVDGLEVRLVPGVELRGRAQRTRGLAQSVKKKVSRRDLEGKQAGQLRNVGPRTAS